MIRELLLNGDKVSFRMEPASDHAILTLGDKTYEIRFRRLKPGNFILQNDRGQHIAYTAREKDRIWVWFNGRTYEFRSPDADEGSGGHHAGEESDVQAPMPGQLVKLMVKSGDQVEAGQIVAVVEAMKMEHSLRAPRAGIVESVLDQVGQTVDAGRIIVKLAVESK